MHFTFTNESDRQMTAGALRLYAEDCRKFAILGGTLSPILTKGSKQAEKLADEIENASLRGAIAGFG
jgi:hypothetical protein